MKILLLRLSSMGDVLHTLPAVTDMRQARPDLCLHWLVEPAFAPIAQLHPGVTRVIPFSLRVHKERWRGLAAALRDLRQGLRDEHYDHILDAQGLYKSALLGRLGGAPLWGLDAASAREPGATRLYHRRFCVAWGQSAISRNRQLFAQALDYPLPETPPDYGLQVAIARLRKDTLAQPWSELARQPFVLGFHGTSRENKEWQEDSGGHWPPCCDRWGCVCCCPQAMRARRRAPGASRNRRIMWSPYPPLRCRSLPP